MAIISSGIGSGLDINSIVTQLVDVQKAPQLQRLGVKEARLQAKLSGYGTLQGALAGLQQSLIALRSRTAFNTHGATAADPAVLSVSASTGAVPGNHQITVGSLASAHRLVSDSALEQARFTAETDVLGTGTLTFRFGTTVQGGGGYAFTPNPALEERTVTITDGSLRGIRDAINQAGIGVQASIVYDGEHYRLALSSRETGAAHSLEITVQDGDGNDADAAGLSLLAFNAGATHMQQTQAASDVGGLVIDGIAVSSASNTLRGVVEGLEITLLAPGSTGITVTADDGAAADAVSDFVDKYNTLVGTINRLSSFDPETGIAGQLNGDGVLRTVETQVRRVLNELMGAGGASFRHLSEIGITHSVEDGTLVLDRDRLQQALAQDREAVTALFAGPAAAGAEGTAPRGYAVELDRVLGGLLSAGGIFSIATEGLNGGIREIARQRELVELRSLAYEERTRAQFTAMDALVGQLRATSDFLMQQLDNLPPIGRQSDR